jgi:hypothetical protein
VNGKYADRGRIECSLFRLTDEGRPHIEPEPGGCYTGGVDTHAGWGWVVRHNRFEDIYCDNGGLAEHAVHFWSASRDTLVENNTIINCARGIGFGLDGDGGDRVYPDNPFDGARYAHYDGIIRNNVIYADNPWHDTGIGIEHAREPLVLHNTVVSGPGATNLFRSIDYRWDDTRTVIRNNLTISLGARDGAQGSVESNLEATPLEYFLSAENLDFHLQGSAANAIDQGLVDSEAGLDLDGEPHAQGAPDLGADEYSP